MRMGLRNIPPVTLTVLGICTTLFYNFLNWKWIPGLFEVCVIPQDVIFGRNWQRLLLSAFFHANSLHLYYNMTSWLWKGSQLERSHGSVKFGVMTVVFALLSSSLLTLISYLLRDSYNGMHTCTVGLSGVLFALKAVLNHEAPGDSMIMGLRVPTKHIVWAELIISSLISPNVSFLGHLCGIFVGLLYVKGYLKPAVDIPSRLISAVLNSQVPVQQFQNHGNNNNWGGGQLGGNPAQQPPWRHPRPQPPATNFSQEFYAAGDPYANQQ